MCAQQWHRAAGSIAAVQGPGHDVRRQEHSTERGSDSGQGKPQHRGAAEQQQRRPRPAGRAASGRESGTTSRTLFKANRKQPTNATKAQPILRTQVGTNS